jgi:hypothetical protein
MIFVHACQNHANVFAAILQSIEINAIYTSLGLV